MEWKLVVSKVVIYWSVLSLIPPNYLEHYPIVVATDSSFAALEFLGKQDLWWWQLDGALSARMFGWNVVKSGEKF
jgi:hypothetical protein